jgi:hypothetical protein
MIGKMKRDDGKSYTMEFNIPERPSTTNNVFVFDSEFQFSVKNKLLTIEKNEEGLNQRIVLKLENFNGMFASELPEVTVFELFFSDLNVMLKYDLQNPVMLAQLASDKHRLENLLNSDYRETV